MSDGVDPSAARTDMVALCMTVAIAPGRLSGLALECDVDTGERFPMTVGDGALRVRSAPSSAPSPTTVACAAGTFIALSLGNEKPASALQSGRLQQYPDAAYDIKRAVTEGDQLLVRKDLTAIDLYVGSEYHEHAPEIPDGPAGLKAGTDAYFKQFRS